MMRIIDDLPNVLGLIRSLRKVSGCPKGIDIPCVFCLECEKSDYSEKEYEDGLIKMTKNSILINIRFREITDPIDRALVGEVIRQLSAKYSVVLDKPEEGYDVTFFIFYGDKAASAELIRILIEKLGNLRSILTEGRIAIKNWARSIVKRYFTI